MRWIALRAAYVTLIRSYFVCAWNLCGLELEVFKFCEIFVHGEGL